MARVTPDAPAIQLQDPLATRTRPGRGRRFAPLGWLALPLLIYVVPLLLGYNWSSISPSTPNIPGLDYDGRRPNTPTTIEWFGTGVVVIPLQARIRAYTEAAELPLWNPYQGLGQPFAAQGEGSPYFPLAVVRALLPYHLSSWITVLAIYAAGVASYAFLRCLGASEIASVFGGIAYELSGAFALYLARPNIADQLCMLAILFWATILALRRRTLVSYILLAVAAAFHAIAGHVQIALLDAMLVVAFIVAYVSVLMPALRTRLRNAGLALGAFILGNGLAAFYLLPVAETIHVSLDVRSEGAGFQPVPFANGIAFLAPTTFGPFFGNWIPGARYGSIDWNNLYAYACVTVTVLIAMGWTVGWQGLSRRTVLGFQFFSLAGIFLLLRYLGFPLVEAVNILPIVGRQTAKHANAATVFCFVMAAALAVDRLRVNPQVRVRWWIALIFGMLCSAVLTLIGLADGFSKVDAKLALTYVPATLIIAATVISGIWLARRWTRLGPSAAGVLVTAVVIAELSVYVPLGNSDTGVLVLRLVLLLLIAGVGLIAALGRRIWATALAILATLVYAGIVSFPSEGLPRQFDVDAAPAYLRWLQAQAGEDYRSFGIAPDFSSVAQVQDIGAVGPFAPTEFADFVDLIATPAVAEHYRAVAHLWITVAIPQNDFYDLAAYTRAKPVLDWAGVRYLTLDEPLLRAMGRTDDQALLAPATGLNVVYDNGSERILESNSARPKAEFWTAAETYPNRASILQALRTDPASVLGPPKLEADEVSMSLPANSEAQPTSATVELYRPNAVVVGVDAPAAGVVVLKDSYFPGWRVSVNGKSEQLVRVNGIVRGVVVPRAGQYQVEFDYRPMSFVAGLLLGVAIALVFALSLVYAHVRKTKVTPIWTMVAGGLLVCGFVALLIQAYWGTID
jgi:hypothetical protein